MSPKAGNSTGTGGNPIHSLTVCPCNCMVQISMNKNNSFLILLCFDHLNSLSQKYGLYFNL